MNKRMSVTNVAATDPTHLSAGNVQPSTSSQSKSNVDEDMFDFSKFRKRSRGSSAVFSQAALANFQKPSYRHEPTYRLDPSVKPKPGVMQHVVDKVLKSALADFTYDAKAASSLSKPLSIEILRQIKKLNYPRYKFLASVFIGQKENMSAQISSRFLWEPKHDTYATTVYSNHSIFAVGIVAAVYCE